MNDKDIIIADLNARIIALRQAIAHEGFLAGDEGLFNRVIDRSEGLLPTTPRAAIDGTIAEIPVEEAQCEDLEVGEEPGDELRAANQVFSWYVRFSVSGTWVADGFNLDDDRALIMLAGDLQWADSGTEISARVVAVPPLDEIAKCQGYADAEDMLARG